MKKFVACGMAALLLSLSAGSASAVNEKRGGVMGFIAGCCFGVRAAGEYNEGKEIHWREWVLLVPYVGIIFSIWNGIDGANGMTTADYAKKYGSIYY